MKDVKNVTCMVIDNGIFVETAVCLARTYKKVYYCVIGWPNSFPKMQEAWIGRGLENIEVVDSPWPYYDEIDLWCFPDIYYGEFQVWLESQGKAVWGARMGEEMELYRDDMKKKMEELGLPLQPYEVIKGTAALREYLKINKNKWIKINKYRGTMETFFSKDYKEVEPKLDEMEYRLGAFKKIIEFVVEDNLPDRVEGGLDCYTIDGEFPTKTLAGIEIKDLGYIGVFIDYDKLPSVITEFNDKLKPTLRDYGYRGFYSTELRINKQKEAVMIDLCFDDKTEVLTNKGWKLFKDLNGSEAIATRSETGFLEYQIPTNYITNKYTGRMIHFSNRRKTFDSLVTPDHDVLRYDRFKKQLFKEKAGSITDKGFIPRTAKWTGIPIEYFILPAYHKEWNFVGKYNQLCCVKVKDEKEVKIPIADWAAFMGWYLTEGSLSTSGDSSQKYVVQLSQTKKVKELKVVLDKIPFEFKYDGEMFRTSSVQLANYLEQFGTCFNKYVPDYIKNATPEVIRYFLDAFNLGDGSIHKGNKVYRTTSPRMAGDIQEMLLKVGSVGNITHGHLKGSIVKWKGQPDYIRNYDCLVIYERNDFKDYWFETGNRKHLYIKEVDYSGFVYCVTVPNGTLFVRRNGKPYWSGNCARQGSPPGELYQELYLNLAEIVWAGANGEVVDPKPIAKYGAELLIHSAWADKNWQPVDFPAKNRRFIKLRNATKIEGRYYIIPQECGLPEIGAAIGYGDTLEKAIEMAKEMAKSVTGYYIESYPDCLEKVQIEIDKLEEFGINYFKE